MTTTELIKILKDNEYGGISHKSRELSFFINGKYMPNPQITLSSTGDGVCGAEIDLDVDGEFYEEQEPKTDVLDKIRAEIEKVVWEDVVASLDGTDEVRIPRLEPEDVFAILDKYKWER